MIKTLLSLLLLICASATAIPRFTVGSTFFWDLGRTQLLKRSSFPKKFNPTVVGIDILGATGLKTQAQMKAYIHSLHAMGKAVVCYVDVGTLEFYRTDVAAFAGTYNRAEVLPGGPNGHSWAEEAILDIKPAHGHLARIKAGMNKRFARVAAVGCDAVEPDNLDIYSLQSVVTPKTTPYGITLKDTLAYVTWVMARIHAYHMKAALKNAPELVAGTKAHPNPDTLVSAAQGMERYTDFAIVEQCATAKATFNNDVSQSFCADYAVYTASGRAVYDIEYIDADPSISVRYFRQRACPLLKKLRLFAALSSLALDGKVYELCR